MSKSSDRKVVLTSIDTPSGGEYRCEVSAEAPSFETVQQDGLMQVAGKPRFKLLPHILVVFSFSKTWISYLQFDATTI